MNEKDMNSRKSLLPLYVYEILSNRTSRNDRLTQQEIIDILDEYPYGITIDRKALGRCINRLEEEDFGIHTSSSGAWHDTRDDWFNMNRPGKWHGAA